MALSQPPNQASVKKAAILLMFSVLISRVIGFFREWVLAQTVGATAATDVYYASFTIPDFLSYAMAVGALSISLIPLLNEFSSREQEWIGRSLYQALFTYLGGALLIFIVVAEIFGLELAQTVAPGFSADQQATLALLLKIILPAQLFFFTGSLATSVLHVHGKFWLPAISPIVYNLFIIGFGIGLYEWLGVSAFSWGVLAGSFVGNGCLLAWGAHRLGFTFRPKFQLELETRLAVKRYLRLSLPIMLGFSLVVTDEWIAKFLASSLEPKLLSWLAYARTEMRIPVAIIGQAAGIASFPYLSRLWAQAKFDEFGSALSVELQRLWAIATLAVVILYAEAIPITQFIYGGGKLEVTDILGVASAVEAYALGVFFWTAQVLLSRAFYAAQRNWLPSVVGTLLSLVAILWYQKLMSLYSYWGLALSGSIGIAVYCFILWYFLKGLIYTHCPGFSFKRLYGFCLSWAVVPAGAWWICRGIHQLGWGEGRLMALSEILLVMGIVGVCAWVLLRKVYVRFTGEPLF